MRTLNELYRILWERIKDEEYISGLCSEITGLREDDAITYEEFLAIRGHFLSQKPSATQHTDFTKHPNWGSYSAWWWKPDEDENPTERKRFVQRMIEIT